MICVYVFQTYWRRAKANPSPMLKKSKWVERVSGLVEYFETGTVIPVAQSTFIVGSQHKEERATFSIADSTQSGHN